MVRGLQGGPEAGRYRHARRRLQAERQGRRQAAKPAARRHAVIALFCIPHGARRATLPGGPIGVYAALLTMRNEPHSAKRCVSKDGRAYTGIRTAARKPPIGLSPTAMAAPCAR